MRRDSRLEEEHGNEEGARAIIKRALKSLQSKNVVMKREDWIERARECEKSGSVVTCQAIIGETIGMEVEDEDRKRIWTEDADTVCFLFFCRKKWLKMGTNGLKWLKMDRNGLNVGQW